MKKNMTYPEWLAEHLAAAKVHYNELCRLDDEEYAKGGSSEYYEQALQMYGYIAALETCQKQVGGAKAAPKKAAGAKKPVKAAKKPAGKKTSRKK
ncbi:MAG: hypothetical protein NDJ90_08290 [Oligoflexia bacterium]|nr:hypothetical protein [Oligoflexia bacterium]